MELIAIDRFMRKPGASWIVAMCTCLFVTVAPLLGRYLARSRGDISAIGSPWPFLILGVISGGFAAGGVASWRRLWRRGRTPAEVLIYDKAVRRTGIGFVLASPFIALGMLLHIGMPLNSLHSWLFLASLAVLCMSMLLPMGLWFAYILGFRSAGHLLVAPGACDERVLPPAVSAPRPAQADGSR